MTRQTRASFDAAMARFTDEQRDALFIAVLAHDDIHDDAALPDAIPLARNQDELAAAFAIVSKLFLDLDSMALARAFMDRLVADPQAAAQQIDTLKHPRARFKHMQFTVNICDARHRYPRLLHGATVIMGEIQDSLRHSDFVRGKRLGQLARIVLGSAGQRWMMRELLSFSPASRTSYDAHIAQQIGTLAAFLGNHVVTAHSFHAARKVISRLMAHYDNLTLLDPAPDRVATARFISTINGLMGGFHDELVAQKLAGTLDYRADTFILPERHRVMLDQLVRGFQTALRARA